MNDGRQMGVHYMDAGFPYVVNENLGYFFQGLTHLPVNYAFVGSMPDQQVALEHALILVDTKYEFGKANDGSILLIEVPILHGVDLYLNLVSTCRMELPTTSRG